MYAQATLKRNIIPHNVAHRIVNRGVQKCTCAGASLRSKKYVPLNCINLDTATDSCMGSGSLLLNAKKYAAEPGYIKYYGQELNTSTYNLARMNMFLHGIVADNQHLMQRIMKGRLFAGVSIASVARCLGHASMTTTQKTYLHIIQELEEEYENYGNIKSRLEVIS